MERMSKEDMDAMLLQRFKVVIPTHRQCRTTCAELRISPSQFIFNRMTAAELAYPKDICCLLSDDNTQMAILATEPNQYSIPFCKIDENDRLVQKGSIFITNKPLVKKLREVLGWKPDGSYVVQAVKYQEGNMLLFDFSTAFIRKKNERRKMTNENLLDMYPPLSQVVKNYRQLALMPPKEKKDNIAGENVVVDVEYNVVASEQDKAV